LNNFLEHIKTIISTGIRSGAIRENLNVDMAATAFFGMLQGVVTIWSLSGFPSTLEMKHQSMWDFFLEAIKTKESTPA
jgi:hypothetical protein